MAESQVRELSYPAYEEDEGGKIRQNKRGELIVSDWKVQAALDGYAYNWAMLTPDTLLTGTVDYTNTIPGIAIEVPVGTTMLPVYFGLTTEDAIGTDNWLHIGFDPADVFASGGLDGSAINNMKTDGPKSRITVAKNGDSAITASDPGTDERFVFCHVDPFALADDRGEHYIQEWKPRVSPVLVGPATFFAYIYSATTAKEYQYTMQWIEVPTASI